MCGIDGIVDYGSGHSIRESVEVMTQCQAHRGPDAGAVFVRDNIGLGHRRLSIIDLAGGKQPFANEEGNVFLTYNGEVYNYRELRDDLRRRGHQFRTSSDTEVVLHAYEEWGKDWASRLEGMFAFSVADFRKREVYIARDHFGIKPLVYFYDGKRLAYSSEIRALTRLPGWIAEYDLESVEQFLRLQYIPDPATIFRKTFKLPPGHCMTVRMGEPHFKIERYWEPPLPARAGRDLSDDALDEVLRDSVKRHLVADVPFGAFLSGGVDSSLIVGYMAELLDRPVKTFSIGFDEPGANELDQARIVATRYSTDHHEEIVRVDALGILPDVVRQYGEPFGDQSAIPTWYVSRLARTAVPMVLSGDGGDEIFAGYGTYGGWLKRMEWLGEPKPTGMGGSARKIARRFWPSRYPTPPTPADNPQNWLDFVGRMNHRQRESLWRPELRYLSDAPNRALDEALAAMEGEGVQRVQQVDLRTFLPADILTKVDIASMAFGLEVRPPIIDVKVFEAASRIRERNLYSFDGASEYQGKLPLKRLLARHMGEEFTRRPKQGFSLPLKAWLHDDPATACRVRELLTSSDTPLSVWFDPVGVKTLLDQKQPQNTWLLLVLDEWLRQQQTAA
ncbi:MAG: asparagine synthase (glutamine-hydrolyzing) [Gemmatimonadales bacterium]